MQGPPLNIKPLPDDAGGSLINPDEKVKKSHGTWGAWTINTLLAIVCILAVAYNASLQGQIKDLKSVVIKQGAKIDTLQNTITSMLKEQIYELRPAKAQAQKAEQKADSIIQNIKP